MPAFFPGDRAVSGQEAYTEKAIWISQSVTSQSMNVSCLNTTFKRVNFTEASGNVTGVVNVCVCGGVNAWLPEGKTQPGCSEGSSSTSLWGRSSSAAIQCPEFQTHSCFHRHLEAERTHTLHIWNISAFCSFNYNNAHLWVSGLDWTLAAQPAAAAAAAVMLIFKVATVELDRLVLLQFGRHL